MRTRGPAERIWYLVAWRIPVLVGRFEGRQAVEEVEGARGGVCVECCVGFCFLHSDRQSAASRHQSNV
jgi:hypothetical protein